MTSMSNSIILNALMTVAALCPIIFNDNPSYSMMIECSICGNRKMDEVIVEPSFRAIFHYEHLYCKHFQEILDTTTHEIFNGVNIDCEQCITKSVHFHNHLFINCPSDHKFQVPLYDFTRTFNVNNNQYFLAGIVNFHDPETINVNSSGHYTACIVQVERWIIIDDLSP
nr:odorant-binding protein 13 [Psyttalia incisi]